MKSFKPLVEWFEGGQTFAAGDRVTSGEYVKRLGGVPLLKKSATEWNVLRKRAEKVPPPTRQEKEVLVREYQIKIQDAQKKLFSEIARVKDIPGGKEALHEVNQAFGPPRK